MLRATVSGSFHRHMTGIYEAVGELRGLGVDVLSPADPRVVDHVGDFLFVASDVLRSVKLVQDRHLEAIRVSDFLLVVCPDGYTGASTSGEIMAAAVLGVPVVSISPALDITIGQYVTVFPGLAAVVAGARSSARRARRQDAEHMLINPSEGVAGCLASIEALGPALTAKGSSVDAERKWAQTRRFVGHKFGFSNDG